MIFCQLSQAEKAFVSSVFRRETGCNRPTEVERLWLLCDAAVLTALLRHAHLFAGGQEDGEEPRIFLKNFRTAALRHQFLFNVWRKIFGTDP